MREIKFRAWDKAKRVMLEKVWMDIGGGAVREGYQNFTQPHKKVDLVPMQYTGLKDKNGVEIYEGDIVRILYTDWPSQSAEKNGRYAMSLDDYKKSISRTGVVAFEDYEYLLHFMGTGLASNVIHAKGSIVAGRHGEVEVIGNIHENEDLLNN